MTPALYNLDPQLRGRALWAMAGSNKFDDTGEHDWGVMLFAPVTNSRVGPRNVAAGADRPRTPPAPPMVCHWGVWFTSLVEGHPPTPACPQDQQAVR